MDEGARVEIELTEHPDAGGRGRRGRRGRRAADAEPRAVASVTPSGVGSTPAPFGAPPADAVVTAGIDPGPPPGPDRGRLVATAAAVGLIALVAGWALGRAGGDSARTVDATPTTERERPADDVTSTVLPGDTMPAASVPTTRPPSTTRPPRTTTTTVPPVWSESSIAVDPRLAGATDRIVAFTEDRELIELDLTTGSLRTLPIASNRAVASSTTTLVAGDDWVAVRFDDGGDSLLVRGDDPVPTDAGGSDQWAVFWQAETATYWTMEYEVNYGYPLLLREHDLDGGLTGRTIDTNGLWVQMPDPAGGVVVTDTSGVYRVTPEGSGRIAAGRPIAIGVGHVVSYACGETLDDCGLVVTDRATGAVRPVPYEMDGPYSLDPWWGATSPTSEVTADGGAVLAATSDPRTGLMTAVVIDTVTGEEMMFEAPASAVEGQVLYNVVSGFWSSDDRFAFVLVDGALLAHERATGEQFLVSSDLPALRAVTRRQPPRPDDL